MQTHPIATAFAEGVASRDPERLGETLTDSVRMRALLPGGAIQADGRVDVISFFSTTFDDLDTVELVESGAEAVGDRLLIHLRLNLSQKSTRWVCTQTAVCRLNDGRLSTFDLLCSGFVEVSSDAYVSASARA